MIGFFLSKHFVITLYILEIAIASILFAAGLLLARRDPNQRVFRALGLVMFLRLIIKLIYFYVEFYIESWPLNIAINVAMDSSYVISMLICVWLISSFVERRKKEGWYIKLVACVFYVFVWLGIQLLSVDPGSNHLIRFTSDTAQTVYFLNELFFYIVFLFDLIRCTSLLHQKRRKRSGWYLFFIICCVAYITYVFIWDISFVVPAIEPFRHSKPLDGVLVFSLGLYVFYFRSEVGDFRELFNPVVTETLTPAISIGEALDSVAYAQAHGLSAREQEVLVLTARGKTNNEIAGELYITDNTVKRHLTSIYKKCAASNRTQLLLDIVEWNKTK